jgi:hypothetical protein
VGRDLARSREPWVPRLDATSSAASEQPHFSAPSFTLQQRDDSHFFISCLKYDYVSLTLVAVRSNLQAETRQLSPLARVSDDHACFHSIARTTDCSPGRSSSGHRLRRCRQDQAISGGCLPSSRRASGRPRSSPSPSRKKAKHCGQARAMLMGSRSEEKKKT